jgi:hypothetical protein
VDTAQQHLPAAYYTHCEQLPSGVNGAKAQTVRLLASIEQQRAKLAVKGILTR